MYRRWIYDLFVRCKRVERAKHSRNRSSWRKCVYVQRRNWHVKHGFNAWYYFQHRIKQRKKNCEYKFIRNELGGLRESRSWSNVFNDREHFCWQKKFKKIAKRQAASKKNEVMKCLEQGYFNISFSESRQESRAEILLRFAFNFTLDFHLNKKNKKCFLKCIKMEGIKMEKILKPKV